MLLQEIYRALIKPVSTTVKKKKEKAKCRHHYGCDAHMNPGLVDVTLVTLQASAAPFTRPPFRVCAADTCFPSRAQIQSGKYRRAGRLLITHRHL